MPCSEHSFILTSPCSRKNVTIPGLLGFCIVHVPLYYIVFQQTFLCHSILTVYKVERKQTKSASLYNFSFLLFGVALKISKFKRKFKTVFLVCCAHYSARHLSYQPFSSFSKGQQRNVLMGLCKVTLTAVCEQNIYDLSGT